MKEMIQKESLSDDALMPFNSMDKYLVNSSNINPMTLQKQVNQNISMQQPNSNCNIIYSGIREGMTEESLRSRTCFNPNFVNQTPFNNINHQYNRMPTMMTAGPVNNEQLSMHHLYMISNNYQPIEKLTLSVNNGNLVGPFHLPPEQIVTEVEFNLTDDSLNQINIRDDLDIVLLSRFTKENAMNLLSWPLSIKISVNDNPLSLDMTSYNKIPLHLPQFIKSNCLPGRNVVKFEMMDLSRFNHQLFQFHIYMVHRPTITHSKKLALDNAYVSDELTIKLLQENCMRLNRDYMMISAICPITDKRIEIPTRFKDCLHLQPFDLMGFFKMQARWMLNICPLCRKNMVFNFNGYQQNIVIDHILQKMFEKVPPGCDMIRIDSNGSFTPMFNNPGPEYFQMMPQNNGVMVMHPRPPFHHTNDNMNAPIMSQQQMRPSLPPMYRYMPVDGPVNGQFINNIQSPPELQYRSMNSNGSSLMLANRSMLDFNPCDMYNAGSMAAVNQSPVKKATKRKPPAKKSATKTNLDPVVNVRTNNNNALLNCPTPPSTRTSSVASTSSPDSLNVPHSIPKRSPSIDQLSNTILSESHLNDELLLYSSTSTNHMNTKSIFSESHFSTSVDEHLVSLPHMSSSSSSFNPSFFSQHQQQQPPYHFSQPQQKLPGWSNNDTQAMFSQQQTYHNQPQQHTPVSSTIAVSTPFTINESDTQTNRLGDDVFGSENKVIKYVDGILANHDSVPELDDCDWLDNRFSGVNIEQEIVGLSDIDDF